MVIHNGFMVIPLAASCWLLGFMVCLYVYICVCVDIQLLNMGIRNKVYHCRGAILYDFYLAKSGLPPAKARIPPGKHEISLATNSSTQTQNLSQCFLEESSFPSPCLPGFIF